MIYAFVFAYIPMGGIIVAFQKYSPRKGILGVTGITPPPAVGKFLKDGDRVRFGESELEVIAVGGHSPGGLCYYSSADRLLIAGDVLFAGSVGRSDLPGGNARVLIEGIRRKLLCLPDEVKVIPGHGPATTIGEEKRYNPFLNKTDMEGWGADLGGGSQRAGGNHG